MKRLLALASLLIPITLFSQGFGSFSHDQPFLAANISSGVSDPTNALPFGIGYWWVASDLSSSPVSTWTDRVSGFILKQTSGANQPTWTTNGVRFTAASSQFMVTNGTPGIFWKFLNTAGNLGDTMLIILDRASTGEQYVFSQNGGGQILGWFSGAAGLWNISATSFGTTTTGKWYDFLYAGTNAAAFNIYTNGVLGVNSAMNARSPSDFGRLNTPTGFYYDGTIKEIIVWTNVIGFTSVQASNIHWYSTNVYKYTP